MNKKNKYLAFVVLLLLFILVKADFPQLAGFSGADSFKYSLKIYFLTAFVLIGVYSLKSVVMIIPAALLYIGAGVMLPIHWAIVVTYIGLFCEFSISYLVGNRLGREKVSGLMKKNKKAKQFLTLNEDKGSISCFFIRLTPLPLDFASMFFGAMGVRYPVFLAFSLLGVTPKVIPFVLMGEAASNPLSKEFLIPFAISGIIVISAFALYQKWQKEGRFFVKEYEPEDLN